jgi:WD40 repeat protein
MLVLLTQLAVVTTAASQPAKTQRVDINGDQLPEGAVARLGTLRFQPPGREGPTHWWYRHSPVLSLSPDGTTVATATHDDKKGTLHFLDTSTGKIVRKLDLGNIQCDHLQFTPDAKGLVLGGWHGIKVVDASTGNVVQSFDMELRRTSLALNADRNWLAVQPAEYAYDAPVKVKDLKTGADVTSLPGRGASCKGLAFGPDGKRLLLWSVVPTQVGNNGMSFGSESKVAVACIDIKERKIVGETTVGTAHHVALGPDGETVALEAADGKSVRVRHLPTGAERCAIPVKSGQFAFAPDANTLLVIEKEGRAALWNATNGKKVRDLEGSLAHKAFQIVGISKDSKTIAVLDGGSDSAAVVVIWNADTGMRATRPPGHEGAITCIAYAPGGKALVSGSIDKTVRLWNPVTGEHLRVLTVHPELITAVAISHDSKLLASSSQSGLIRLSNMADGKVVTEFKGSDKGVSTLAFSPDSKILFAGGHSPEVLAWQIADGKEAVRFKTGADGEVMAFGNGGALALTANGEWRAEATPERMQVWKTIDKLPVNSLTLRNEEHGDVRCEAAIFSPQGRMIASSQISVYEGVRPSYANAQLRVWERVSGQPILTLSPSVTKILAFSANGRYLAAGAPGRSGHLMYGYGSGIDVWDTLTGKKAGALPITPNCVAFSPDGLHLTTGGRDHSILIWPAPKTQPLQTDKVPSATERDAWWTALGGNAKDAYQVIGQMLDTPEQAVTLLKERVQPVQRADPDIVAKLIVQLDSDTFAERMKAQEALEKMGEGATHLLKQALERKVSLELSRRLETILSNCDAISPLGLRHHRAVATLEWIDTPAARALLQTLADGAPAARLTVEAQAALKRLKE